MSDHEPQHAANKPAVNARADARVRGWRTVGQGAISAVLVAVAAVVLDVVTPGVAIDWPALAGMAGTAALTALIAYAQRRLEGRYG